MEGVCHGISLLKYSALTVVIFKICNPNFFLVQIATNFHFSNWVPVISGVPQGSVSGPLLFLIYIDDLDTNIVSNRSKFADDTKLCHRARNPDDIMELQDNINKLVDWANKWQINFNVDKCSVMQIGHNNMQGNYNMSNQQLPTTDQQRDLGIIITKDFKLQKQTEKNFKTANRVLGFIYRNFRCKKQRTDPPIIQIPSSPTSRTCSAILVPLFKTRHIDKIEKIQRRATCKDDS